MKDTDFIIIPAFTQTILGLKGNEQKLYSLIWGFSKDGEHEFKGSVRYMAEWLNSSKQTVHNTLNSLLEKNHITKKEEIINNVKFISYKAIAPQFDQYSKSLIGVVKKFDGGSQKVVRNDNIDYNINNINISSNSNNSLNNLTSTNSCKNQEEISENISETNVSPIFSVQTKKNHSKRFEKPTFEELKAYVEEKGYNIDPQYFIDYYDSCGWTVGKNKPMRDWKAAVRTWVRNNKEWNDNKQHTAHSDNPIDKYGGHNRSIDRTFGPGDEIPF